MSAEVQTSLFIITAEIAVVSTMAALLAAGIAWSRWRARLKAAQALRDAAARLPGEGEIVQKEGELLGDFARAYLMRDAGALASLPARLLALRQMYESTQVAKESVDKQLTLSGDIQVFCFRIESVPYGVRIEHVLAIDQDVSRLRAVPSQTRGFIGLIEYLGVVVPVIDLAQMLGFKSDREV